MFVCVYEKNNFHYRGCRCYITGLNLSTDLKGGCEKAQEFWWGGCTRKREEGGGWKKETEEKCEEKLFAFEEVKKYIFSPPPFHIEEPNSKARNVNYRSFQGSSSRVQRDGFLTRSEGVGSGGDVGGREYGFYLTFLFYIHSSILFPKCINVLLFSKSDTRRSIRNKTRKRQKIAGWDTCWRRMNTSNLFLFYVLHLCVSLYTHPLFFPSLLAFIPPRTFLRLRVLLARESPHMNNAQD